MPNARQPWPMKWIVLAIFLAVVPYTIVTLRYRKPGPAFQPYEDMKERANVSRLLAAGYQRIPLAAQRPADGDRVPGGAAITSAPGGVPAELRSTLVEPPLLPKEIVGVSAAPSTPARHDYTLQFTCVLPTDKQYLGGVDLYVRGEKLVLVPTFERADGALLTRTRETIVRVTLPAGTLQPGRYDVTLLGETASRTWPLEVH